MTTILCDVDGVLADFVGRACKTIWMHTELSYQASDFTHWDLGKTLSPEANTALSALMTEEFWCDGIPMYPGAYDFINELKGLGDLVAVTAPLASSQFWLQERANWLKAAGIDDVIFCPSKKKKLIEGHFLIEDNLATVNDWVYAREDSRIAILIDRPWNQGDVEADVVRVKHYADALNVICGTHGFT